jgi:phosphatidate cytidylyltransferase
MTDPMSATPPRRITLLLLVGLLGALFFLPIQGWPALCALICGGAAWEWGALAGWPGRAREIYALALTVLCFVLAGSYTIKWLEWLKCLEWLAMAFWLLVAPFWLKYKWPLRAWNAVLVGGIVLLPPMLAFIALRHIHPIAVLSAVAPVWVADIAAYFSGRAFGRAKLAPGISPGKTWAGAVGAALGVALYFGVNFVVLRGGSFISAGSLLGLLPGILAWGVGLTALSIVGDLFESLLKRKAGVKDSGHFLPGHGGILDRIDSLTSTLPIWFTPTAPVPIPIFFMRP